MDKITLVIFGATGDLATKKLFPALYSLFEHGRLPEHIHIVGVSRGSMTDDDFRAYIQKEALGGSAKDTFLSRVSFAAVDLKQHDDHLRLKEALDEREKEDGCVNRLYYLAVPPSLYETIVEGLRTSGLSEQMQNAWRRLLIEKPFGFDLESARSLNTKIAGAFPESEVFRIDHYLAKDVTQNIIAFRFSNVLFEPVWNSKYISHIHLRLYEQKGVENRGSFYEQVGALRDVGQNHLLQMLALVTMDHPRKLDANNVSREREKILRALKPYTPTNVNAHVGRGQYAGYRDIQGVPPDSNTETYFALRTYIETDRWRGVPITLEGGKKMPEDLISIEVHFKPQMPCACGSNDPAHEHGNVITFSIKPEIGITVDFWAKKPGIEYELESQHLGFSYQATKGAPDAYVKLVRNALSGERMAFPSAGEIEASWAFVTPILESWRDSTFTFYETNTCPDSTKLIT